MDRRKDDLKFDPENLPLMFSLRAQGAIMVSRLFLFRLADSVDRQTSIRMNFHEIVLAQNDNLLAAAQVKWITH